MLDHELLPEPVLPAHPEWIELYWRAWDILSQRMRHGTTQNEFAPDYLDAAFSENIFQWDTCFIAAFARYGGHVFPVTASLDNFYHKQHADGFICREIDAAGQDCWPPNSDQAINPPLFAWAEWLNFQITGDDQRLRDVWSLLDRYYRWIVAHRMDEGLYHTSNLGSGMDNSPRCGWQWVDLSAQQAHAAKILAQIAIILGNIDGATQYRQEYANLAQRINESMWDERDGFYYDTLHRAEHRYGFARCKTLATFWPLLAGIVPPQRATQLVEHLQNPNEFNRPHPFPTLSADHPSYLPTGGYWLGGVWAPMNYMVIKGLDANGYSHLGRHFAEQYLTQLAEVAAKTGTLWENYAPEFAAPGRPARADFVGWSGLGPIALLIEDVLGITVDAPAQRICWRIRPGETQGIRRLRMGANIIDLMIEDGQCRVLAILSFSLILIDKNARRELWIAANSFTTIQL